MSSVWAELARALSPVEDRPRLMPHIESARYTTRSGAPYVVVHNLQAHTYARLDPREFELLGLMDGSRGVKELVIAYYQRHGVLALARIAGLVSLLREQHFVADWVDAYPELARALRGAGLSRVRAASPSRIDGLLGALYAAGGHVLFHSVWLWLGVALGIVGPGLVIYQLVTGRYALFDQGALGVVSVVVVALVALAIHELGHGLAVKHARRAVHAAGVRLYYGLPAAYVDTTDVWMAPPAQRLLTAFAGPWTGLVLCGLCAIAATVASDATLGALLFTVAYVFMLDNLFNFNPLLELDGYYMLIDYLDRPLLRPEALAFVRGPFWSRLRGRQPLTRDEKLLALFGGAAVLYSLLAVVLAVRSWQALLAPLIVNNLVSGDLPRQALALAIVVPLAVGVLALLGRAARPLRKRLAQASREAAAYRYRDALAALREVPLWSDLPRGRLLEIARAMRPRHVAAGTELVRQGDVGERFYLIERGGFEVRVNDVPRARLGRGDFFGERALLQRGPRAATVVATEPGQVLVLERAEFERLLASDLAASTRLQSALELREEVAAMPLLSDLSPGELTALLGHLVPLDVAAGEVVIRQGERGDRFYLVRSGRLQVSRDRQILAHLVQGDAFGEIALLMDVPRTATVTALEPTTLLALDAEHFRDVLASYLGRSTELERLSHLRLLSHRRLDEVV